LGGRRRLHCRLLLLTLTFPLLAKLLLALALLTFPLLAELLLALTLLALPLLP
jgi:hypothetical protein